MRLSTNALLAACLLKGSLAKPVGYPRDLPVPLVQHTVLQQQQQQQHLHGRFLHITGTGSAILFLSPMPS